MNYRDVIVCSLFLLSLATAQDCKDNNQQKDFGILGCFKVADLNDSHRSVPYIPQSVDEIKTRFLVYTQQNKPGSGTEKVIEYDNEATVTSSGFKQGLPVTFITHGYTRNGLDKWIQDVATRTLAMKDVNVIAVDWKDGAKGGNFIWPYNRYKQAVSNTWVVGKQIAKVCEFVKKHLGVKYEDVHLIGHSLGSHVSGYAGAALNGQLGRITGLDPAQPEFQDTATHIRLDETDAQFVDAIHTDARTFNYLFGNGIKQLVGTVDFFPNGGISQPGCWDKRDNSKDKKHAKRSSCRHSRAYEYYLDTIAPESEDSCTFMAHECESYENFEKGKCNSCGEDGSKCLRMGYYANKYTNPTKSVNHVFYLTTKDKSPFCVYNYGIEMTGSSSEYLSFTLSGALSSHSFNFRANSGEPISRVFVSPKKLGSVNKVSVDCSACNDTTKITVTPIDITDKTKRTSETSVLCHSSASGSYHEFKKC